MTQLMKYAIPMIFAGLILLLVLSTALAQSNDYELLSFTISSGGGQSSGGEYNLTANIAQPDIEKMSGGEYDMSGGFQPGGSQPSVHNVNRYIYLPIILRS